MFEASGKTTVNHDELVPVVGFIPLAPELIEFVRGGKKLITYRYGDKYDYLNAGDEVQIADSATGHYVLKASIVSKNKVKFEDMDSQEEGHEAYRDKEHYREVLSGYYAYLGRPIADEDSFLRFEFKQV